MLTDEQKRTAQRAFWDCKDNVPESVYAACEAVLASRARRDVEKAAEADPLPFSDRAYAAAPFLQEREQDESLLIERDTDEFIMKTNLARCYNARNFTGFHVSAEHYRYLAEQIVSLRVHIKRTAAQPASPAPEQPRTEPATVPRSVAIQLKEALEWIQKCASGEQQIAPDDTEGMNYIDLFAQDALEAARRAGL